MIKNSIIITFYQGLNILKTNLQLLATTINEECEVIVVNDNPSIKLESTSLCTTTENFSVISPKNNGGYSAACNLGAKYAKGENLIFMDCDIMPTDNWLQPLLSELLENENCGAVSSTILNMNTGGVVHWGMGIVHGVDVVKPFRDGILPNSLASTSKEFKLLTSGCILIPKKIFEDVNGFDVLLYNGYCDLDIIMKIRELGYVCIATSKSVVYHRGKVAGVTRIASEEDTRALFVNRWNDRLPDDGIELFKFLLGCQPDIPKPSDVLFINFCRSLYAQEYHEAFKDEFSLKVSAYYEFRNIHESQTLLEDYLPWSLAALNTPIVYFCDNITTLMNNNHWFSHRINKGDFLVDRNGNLIAVNKIVST